MFGLLRKYKRRRLQRQPLRDSHRKILAHYVKPYLRFDQDTKNKFENCVKVLVAEQSWEACNGFRIDEEMRLAIAGNASLMLLGNEGYFFSSVRTILVYPNAINRNHDGHFSVRVGEAWQFGPIILSWSEVKANASNCDGQNVVIHEFAHHLDGLDGEMGGMIPFKKPADQQQWQEISTREYERLLAAANLGQPTLLDPYGAENRAEFFAVASECFFEQPRAMKFQLPELFDQLVKFYQLDPLRW